MRCSPGDPGGHLLHEKHIRTYKPAHRRPLELMELPAGVTRRGRTRNREEAQRDEAEGSQRVERVEGVMSKRGFRGEEQNREIDRSWEPQGRGHGEGRAAGRKQIKPDR